MTALAKIPVWMSVEEFLAWEPGDGRRWQLVDGEPQAMSLTNIGHGMLHAQVGGLIGNHLHAQDSACTVVMFPAVVPHVNASHNMRIADLAVTCSSYEVEEIALTDPVLVVEIMSVESWAETWANVWAYTSIPSVREILVLKSAAIGAEVLRRDEDGSWPQEPERVVKGELVLASIGLRVPISDIYAGTRLSPSG